MDKQKIIKLSLISVAVAATLGKAVADENAKAKTVAAAAATQEAGTFGKIFGFGKNYAIPAWSAYSEFKWRNDQRSFMAQTSEQLSQINQKLDDLNKKSDAIYDSVDDTKSRIEELYTLNLTKSLRSNYNDWHKYAIEPHIENIYKSWTGINTQYISSMKSSDSNSMADMQFEYASGKCNQKAYKDMHSAYDGINGQEGAKVKMFSASTNNAISDLQSDASDIIKEFTTAKPKYFISNPLELANYYNNQSVKVKQDVTGSFDKMYALEVTMLSYRYACGYLNQGEFEYNGLGYIPPVNLADSKETRLNDFKIALGQLNKYYGVSKDHLDYNGPYMHLLKRLDYLFPVMPSDTVAKIFDIATNQPDEKHFFADSYNKNCYTEKLNFQNSPGFHITQLQASCLISHNDEKVTTAHLGIDIPYYVDGSGGSNDKLYTVNGIGFNTGINKLQLESITAMDDIFNNSQRKTKTLEKLSEVLNFDKMKSYSQTSEEQFWKTGKTVRCRQNIIWPVTQFSYNENDFSQAQSTITAKNNWEDWGNRLYDQVDGNDKIDVKWMRPSQSHFFDTANYNTTNKFYLTTNNASSDGEPSPKDTFYFKNYQDSNNVKNRRFDMIRMVYTNSGHLFFVDEAYMIANPTDLHNSKDDLSIRGDSNGKDIYTHHANIKFNFMGVVHDGLGCLNDDPGVCKTYADNGYSSVDFQFPAEKVTFNEVSIEKATKNAQDIPHQECARKHDAMLYNHSLKIVLGDKAHMADINTVTAKHYNFKFVQHSNSNTPYSRYLSETGEEFKLGPNDKNKDILINGSNVFGWKDGVLAVRVNGSIKEGHPFISNDNHTVPVIFPGVTRVEFKNGDMRMYNRGGNLVFSISNEYTKAGKLWIPDHYARIDMQNDGNLVVYSSQDHNVNEHNSENNKHIGWDSHVIWAISNFGEKIWGLDYGI